MIKLISASFLTHAKESDAINQDTILPPMQASGGWLFAIADGLGGYNGGQLASQSVIEYLAANFNKELGNGFENLFLNLKENIKKISDTDKNLVNAASTLTFCHVEENSIHVGHIGDCRLYYKDGVKLRQITKDHTQHQVFIDEGIFTATELKKAKGKNILTTAISRTFNLEYNINKININDLQGSDETIVLYLMSDGAHEFWERRPRFSVNTLSEPSRYCSSLQKRIESGPPVDDYSVISIKLQR